MRERFRGLAAIGVSVVGFATLSPGAALAGTLDQQQTDTTGGNTYIQSGQAGGQTFTAGLSGKLDRVDLYLGTQGTVAFPLSVEVRNVSGGQPGSTVLTSQSVPPSSVTASGAFVAVNFATSVPVAAGAQYAIVAYSSAPNPNNYAWFLSLTANAYTRGGGFYTSNPPPSFGAWTSTSDYAFKTYVVPTPPTGQRAAALKKCKHKHGHKRKRCKKKANLLPV